MGAKRYDHPSYETVRVASYRTTGTTSAATAGAAMYTPFPLVLDKIHINVATAGIAGSSVTVLSVSGTSTTTQGSYSNGTAAAGSQTTITPTDTTLPAGTITYAVCGTSTQNGVFDVAYEHRFDNTATFTA